MRYLELVWSSKFSVTVFWLAVFLIIFYTLKWLFIKKGKVVVKFLISLIVSIGGGVKDNPGINNFFNRHAVLAKFLKKKVDRSKFSGLTLTVLSLVALYAVIVFAGVVVGVFVTGNAISADLSLANLFHDFRNPLLVKIFLWITLLGNWRIVAAMVLVILMLFWLWDKKLYILPFLVSVGGGFFTSVVAKNFWHRPRPLEAAVYLEKSWSFPSGHAVLAVALYGFLIYFFWKYFKNWKNKTNVLFLGLLVIILIGFSRLYLGVHYLSDVWAGGMVGLFWLIVGIGLVESQKTSLFLPGSGSVFSRLVKTYESMLGIGEGIKFRYLKIITVGLVFLLVVGYIGYGLRYKPLFNIGSDEDVVRGVNDTKAGDIFTDYQLPKFTETLLGNLQEPISFIVIADNDEQLIKSFQLANWFLADKADVYSLMTAFKLQFLNKPYPTAPMTPYFWRTYTNDFGFEEPTEVNSARYRHHARFWQTNLVTVANKKIYVGIASLDTGVKWWGLTHKIKPDIDSERDYLFDALSKALVVSDYKKIQFVDPVLGKNFTGDQFFTDGKAYIIYLK